MEPVTMGDPCPACGGTEYYCAEEIDSLLRLRDIDREEIERIRFRSYCGERAVQDRMEIDGHILIISPKPKAGTGYYHSFTERKFLVTNLLNFLASHSDIHPQMVMLYELQEMNE